VSTVLSRDFSAGVVQSLRTLAGQRTLVPV
jgi:hypothetical protein